MEIIRRNAKHEMALRMLGSGAVGAILGVAVVALVYQSQIKDLRAKVASLQALTAQSPTGVAPTFPMPVGGVAVRAVQAVPVPVPAAPAMASAPDVASQAQSAAQPVSAAQVQPTAPIASVVAPVVAKAAVPSASVTEVAEKPMSQVKKSEPVKPVAPKPKEPKVTPRVVAPVREAAAPSTPIRETVTPVVPTAPAQPVAVPAQASVAAPAPAPATVNGKPVMNATIEQARIQGMDGAGVVFKDGLRVQVGEKFPSGEKLLSVSPGARRIETDRRIINLKVGPDEAAAVNSGASN